MFEVELGELGADYVRHHLLGPGFRLGALVANRIAGDSGRCLAIVPDGTSLERAQQTETGGFGSKHELQALESVSKEVIRLMGAYEGVELVAEEPTKTLEDDLSEGGLSRFTHGREVYLHTANPDSDLVAEILTWADAVWTLNAVVSKSVGELNLPLDGSSVSDSDLEQIVAGCLLVIVSAYDREGYVVYEPSRP